MQSYLINSQKRKLQAVIVAFIIITMLSQWFAPLIVHAEEERELEFNTSLTLFKDGETTPFRKTVKVKGQGHFVATSFQYIADTSYSFRMFIVSEKPFYRTLHSVSAYGQTTTNTDIGQATYYGGVYYLSVADYGGTCAVDTQIQSKGLVNVTDCSDSNFFDILKERIDNNYYDLSKDDYKELVFDTNTAQFSSDIPTPRITVDNNYNLSFNNATDNYYFQIKGRWYSVDDIELYKQSAQWKYKYNSIIKSGLTEWTEKAIKTNTSDLNLATLGKSAFDNFLSQNPIDSRSYTGGTNALGNYFSGYNDALSTIKMLLKQPTTLYNGLEIYVRYYEFDSNGVAHYGKWCHYYDNLANANGSSGSQWDDKNNMFMGNQSSSGLTDDQFNDVENTGNSTKADTDLVPDYNDSGTGSVIIGDADLTSITTTLKSLYSQGQEIINMFGQVFSFLPSWLTAFICTSIGLVCLIGIIKALRG